MKTRKNVQLLDMIDPAIKQHLLDTCRFILRANSVQRAGVRALLVRNLVSGEPLRDLAFQLKLTEETTASMRRQIEEEILSDGPAILREALKASRVAQ